MPIEFKLPDLGEGIASADVAGLLVAEGDEIQPEQNVLELETDKAVIELPCPHAGKVSKIHVKPGETVKPGQLLLSIDSADAPAASGGKKPESSKPAESTAAPAAAATKTDPTRASGAAPKTVRPAPTAQGGTFTFTLPDLGEGITKADVAGILVTVGDEITAEQNVLELETDKAVIELPSPQAGKVTKVLVKVGDTIQPGTDLLQLEATGLTEATPSPAASRPSAGDTSTPARPQPAQPRETSFPDPGASQGHAVKATAPVPSGGQEAGNGAPPPPAGPATRRLARELGVDLHRVKGSGPGGRITAEDVQGFVRELIESASQGGGGPAAGGIAIPPLPDFTQFGPVERKPMNKIARTAAANLSLAWQTIPHVTQHELADITELEAGRKRHSQGKGAAKITMTVLAIKAIVAALKQYPNFNASLDTTTNEIILKQFYHIGVAVDTEAGLLVPVIRDANQKSILEIARELDELAGRARERKLSPADFQGGTFTITNLGGIGGTMFTPIVNYPEVAILGMSRAKQQQVIIDNKPELRLMLPLSLSYDHRVINGADAARFIVKVAGLLADPSQLLIES